MGDSLKPISDGEGMHPKFGGIHSLFRNAIIKLLGGRWNSGSARSVEVACHRLRSQLETLQ